ncbi:hypothetical protein VP01_2924g3 [Puccinia sorghi]|uniref:Polysaccharide biosynthesis domain-containing protein n=1 Tax=Puccinia sorghi TaxID=27349 RepID=A0A0L6V166_9BASI|nr:hypothetical protein VP01_2924g3 [Puccinia sorghi]
MAKASPTKRQKLLTRGVMTYGASLPSGGSPAGSRRLPEACYKLGLYQALRSGGGLGTAASHTPNCSNVINHTDVTSPTRNEMDIPSDPVPKNFDAANAPNLPEVCTEPLLQKKPVVITADSFHTPSSRNSSVISLSFRKYLSRYAHILIFPVTHYRFAVRCIEQAETYWNLLGAIPPSKMKLTKHDDEILKEFQAAFPEMSSNKDGKLQKIDEGMLKSPEGKESWRKYIKLFENTVADYNFGTLIRTNSREDYTEKNTMFITRIQFYAIEICRNRLGLNDRAHELAKKEWNEKQAKK